MYQSIRNNDQDDQELMHSIIGLRLPIYVQAKNSYNNNTAP